MVETGTSRKCDSDGGGKGGGDAAVVVMAVVFEGPLKNSRSRHPRRAKRKTGRRKVNLRFSSSLDTALKFRLRDPATWNIGNFVSQHKTSFLGIKCPSTLHQRLSLEQHFFPFLLCLRQNRDSPACSQLDPFLVEHTCANAYGQICSSIERKVPDASRVDPPSARLELVQQDQGPSLRRSRHRAHGEGRADAVQGVEVGEELTADGGDKLVHRRVRLDAHELRAVD
eukprot:763596-Hanusia_phi.AAC.2